MNAPTIKMKNRPKLRGVYACLALTLMTNFAYAEGPVFTSPDYVIVAPGEQFRLNLSASYDNYLRPSAFSPESHPQWVNFSSHTTNTALAEINHPQGIALDRDDNLIVADTDLGLIQKIIPTVETTVLASGFDRPQGVAVDRDGNVYVTQENDMIIRKINAVGEVTIFADLGDGDDFHRGHHIAVDTLGNVYVPINNGPLSSIVKIDPSGTVSSAPGSEANVTYDSLAMGLDGNLYSVIFDNEAHENRVRKLTTSGDVTDYAIPNNEAAYNVTADAAGNMYVLTSQSIEKLTPAGESFNVGFNLTLNAIEQAITGIAIDADNNIYLSQHSGYTEPNEGNSNAFGDTGANISEVRKLEYGPRLFGIPPFEALGNHSVVVRALGVDENRDPGVDENGDPVETIQTVTIYVVDPGLDDILFYAKDANFSPPTLSHYNFLGITGVTTGNLGIINQAVAESDIEDIDTIDELRALVNATNPVSNPPPVFTSADSVSIEIGQPFSHTLIATDSANDALTFGLFVDSTPTQWVRTSPQAIVSTFADVGESNASSITIDSLGNFYTADDARHVIHKITPSGDVSIFAGALGQDDSVDGTGAEARFIRPFGVASDADDNIFVADSINGTIRKITPAGLVTTFAGDGLNDVFFFGPVDVAVGSDGNIFVADFNNHAIRKITPEGDVTTLAGALGTAGYNDDTGSAARFDQPFGVVVDSDGHVYVADSGNHRIRKISPEGSVTTLAGSGKTGSTDGSGAEASFNQPFDVAVDAAGNVYVADYSNHKVRKISPAGIVTTVAGSGENESLDGASTDASFSFPSGIAIDANGDIYVSDTFSGKIRKITEGIALTGSPSHSDIGTHEVVVVATDGFDTTIQSIALTVTEAGHQAIISFANDQQHTIPTPAIYSNAGISGVTSENISAINASVSELAGEDIDSVQALQTLVDDINASINSVPMFTSDSDATATVDQPFRHTLSAIDATNDRLFFSLELNPRPPEWLVLSPGGGPASVSTLAGDNVQKNQDYSFSFVRDVATDSAGNVYVADYYNARIQKVSPDGVVSTFTGNQFDDSQNGPSFGIGNPTGIAVDSEDNVLVTSDNQIFKIAQSGDITLLVGDQELDIDQDIFGPSATLSGPVGLTTDSAGNVYVADTGNNKIRKISPEGLITTIAENNEHNYRIGAKASGDDLGFSPEVNFDRPTDVAIDSLGNIFVVDSNNNQIRKITPSGDIKNFAGSGNLGSVDGPAEHAEFDSPFGVTIDAEDNLYVSDRAGNQIRKISVDGFVTTVAGHEDKNDGSFDGLASEARFYSPMGLAADADGNIYVADSANDSVRKINVPSIHPQLVGGPGEKDVGTQTVVVAVTDGFSTTTQTITITVIDDGLGAIVNFINNSDNNKPTVNNFTDAGITGVTDENIDAINQAIATNDLRGVESAEQLQGFINYALDLIKSVPEFTSADELTASVGEQFQHQLTARDETDARLSFNFAAEPPQWLSLSNSIAIDRGDNLARGPLILDGDLDGEFIGDIGYPDAGATLVGTPSENDLGNHTVIIAVSNGFNSTTQTVTVSVVTIGHQTILDYTYYDHYYGDEDPTPPGLDSYTDAGVTGVTEENLDAINEVISTVYVEDINTPEELQTLINDVNASIDSVPVFTSVSNITAIAGESFSHTLSAIDAVDIYLIFSLEDNPTPPQWLRLSNNNFFPITDNSISGPKITDLDVVGDIGLPFGGTSLEGSPAENDIGSYDVVVAVTDYFNTTTQTITINVVSADQGIIIDFIADEQSETPSVDTFTNAGVTGVTDENIDAIIAVLANNDIGGIESVAELQDFVDYMVASIDSVPEFTSPSELTTSVGCR